MAEIKGGKSEAEIPPHRHVPLTQAIKVDGNDDWEPRAYSLIALSHPVNVAIDYRMKPTASLDSSSFSKVVKAYTAYFNAAMLDTPMPVLVQKVTEVSSTSSSELSTKVGEKRKASEQDDLSEVD